MTSKTNPQLAKKRRHERIRAKIAGKTSRPRLCVFRSLNHIYAQIVDDEQGRTLTSASTLSAEIRADAEKKTKSEAAKLVGSLVAKRALERAITQVVFDRGGCKYHGRVKSLAEAAREGGLKF